MAKYAIIVMSEHSEGNPGGQAPGVAFRQRH